MRRDLVIAAMAGDHEAFSELARLSVDQLHAIARLILHDPERAKDGPFGTAIAHGYLTLSLLPAFLESLYKIESLKMGLNYGANKLRFLTPVPVDSRVRGTATLVDTTEIAIGTQSTLSFVVELEGAEKPALIAEVVYVMAE